jgi:hypothetical protein
MAANIAITSPSPNSRVPRSFISTGTWQAASIPSITVVLKDSFGSVVATGVTSVAFDHSWSSSFLVSQDYSNATISATITGSTISDAVSGITVSDSTSTSG